MELWEEAGKGEGPPNFSQSTQDCEYPPSPRTSLTCWLSQGAGEGVDISEVGAEQLDRDLQNEDNPAKQKDAYSLPTNGATGQQ